jgi:hypothetical protein
MSEPRASRILNEARVAFLALASIIINEARA